MRDLFYSLMERAGAARVREFVAAAETLPALAPLRGQRACPRAPRRRQGLVNGSQGRVSDDCCIGFDNHR